MTSEPESSQRGTLVYQIQVKVDLGEDRPPFWAKFFREGEIRRKDEEETLTWLRRRYPDNEFRLVMVETLERETVLDG